MRLEGIEAVLFEARHAKTLAELVAKQGGRPFSAPAMKEIPLGDNPEAFRFAEALFAGRVDVLVLLTGVGTRYLTDVLAEKYPREKVIEAYKKTVIVPRGPKPIRVLNEWGVPFALTVPEPNTWNELVRSLDQNKEKVPVSGKTVAVQEYGVSNEELIRALQERGASVMRVPVYRWALPDDLSPLKEAVARILDGRTGLTVFTTAVQIAHVLQVAQTMGKKEPLVAALNRTVVASVGPDCSEALRSHGVAVDIEPESPKMGPLVVAAAEKAAAILSKKIK